MTLMSPGDLAMVRTAMLGSFTNSVTSSRTHVTRDCRIWAAKRSDRITGLPSYVRVPVWHIALPVGDPVQAGDQEMSPGDGTYTVSEVLNPADFSANTDVLAVRTLDASRNLVLGFPPNATVTFKRPVSAETITNVPVLMRRADQMNDPHSEDGIPTYQWHLTYPLATAYTSDDARPDVNHYIDCSELTREATIADHPDRATNQFFGLASLYFNAIG